MLRSRRRRSRRSSSVWPTCLRSTWPPAASSWVRSRGAPSVRWFSTRTSTWPGPDGAAAFPPADGGGWQETNPARESARSVRIRGSGVIAACLQDPSGTLKRFRDCAPKQGGRASLRNPQSGWLDERSISGSASCATGGESARRPSHTMLGPAVGWVRGAHCLPAPFAGEISRGLNEGNAVDAGLLLAPSSATHSQTRLPLPPTNERASE